MNRRVTRPEVRVGGVWLSSIFQHWGSLRTATRPQGDWQASWEVILHHGQRHSAIVYGAPVEVFLGPIPVFVGTLTEPDWDAGTMTAIGACREAEAVPAFTAALLTTTAPNTAVDQAIARGELSWTRGDDFGTTPVGEEAGQGGVVTVESVLNAWTEENAIGWRISRDRVLEQHTPAESDPEWFVVPGAGDLGQNDDERIDRVYVLYMSSTAGALGVAAYPSTSVAVPGARVRTMDITDRGRKSLAEAEQIAQSEWENARSGWTNGLTVTSGQVTTRGGTRANLALIRAGQSIRLLGVPDPRGLAQNLDVIIGDTELDWEADTLQVNPLGMASGDRESVLEQLGTLAASATQKAAAASALAAQIGNVWVGTGTVVIGAGASTGTVVIPFPTGRFTVAPTCVVTTNLQNYYANDAGVTTSQITVRANHRDGTNGAANVGVRVVAIQQ